MITKFFGASETTWDKKRSKRRQTDTEGSQSEGEDITTTDIVSKGKARQRKGRLVAKEQRRNYGACPARGFSSDVNEAMKASLIWLQRRKIEHARVTKKMYNAPGSRISCIG